MLDQVSGLMDRRLPGAEKALQLLIFPLKSFDLLFPRLAGNDEGAAEGDGEERPSRFG